MTGTTGRYVLTHHILAHQKGIRAFRERSIWMYLLLNATNKEMAVMFCGQKITIHPGQLITGRKKIAEKFNISESKV